MLRSAPLFAAWCAADPGSTASAPRGSRLCGAALHAAPRPGHRLVAGALLTPWIIGILPANPGAFRKAPEKRSGQNNTMKIGRIGAIVAAGLTFLAGSRAGGAQGCFPNRPVGD